MPHGASAGFQSTSIISASLAESQQNLTLWRKSTHWGLMGESQQILTLNPNGASRLTHLVKDSALESGDAFPGYPNYLNLHLRKPPFHRWPDNQTRNLRRRD